MKSGFTLIELLVVLLLMTIVLSITVPRGAKLFKQFQDYIKKVENKHQLNQDQAFAFIEAKEKNCIINDVNYTISVKGVLHK